VLHSLRNNKTIIANTSHIADTIQPHRHKRWWWQTVVIKQLCFPRFRYFCYCCSNALMIWLWRFHKFLLYLGYTPQASREAKVGLFCKTVSEFALEYRTTREKLLQQREKKATQRERRRTRGKMIVEVLASILNFVLGLKCKNVSWRGLKCSLFTWIIVSSCIHQTQH